MTASPRRAEVVANLRPGEQAHNRPYRASVSPEAACIDARLNCEHCAGRVIAFAYVLEFQKRGLPRARILLVFDKQSKPRSAKDVDRLVSAEIPTGEDQKELRDLVESCLTHGPCGALNPSCPCMENGVCMKNTQKRFRKRRRGARAVIRTVVDESLSLAKILARR